MSTSPQAGPSNPTYRALKTEQGVFTTPVYSAAIKPHWRIKDEATARRSAQAIWGLFESYRDQDDFIGMDTTRKFLQMGRTRSLRYALRQGGRKYDKQTGEEMQRTGKVYDQGKLKGAGVFEGYLKLCWEDAVYVERWDGWREGQGMGKGTGSGSGKRKGKGKEKEKGSKEGPGVKTANVDVSGEQGMDGLVRMEEEEDVKPDIDRVEGGRHEEGPEGGDENPEEVEQVGRSERVHSQKRRRAPESPPDFKQEPDDPVSPNPIASRTRRKR